MDLLLFGNKGWGDELLFGALSTTSLSVTALPIGLIIGLALAFCRASSNLSLRTAGNGLTTIFRGLPELLTILLFYILGQRLLNQLARELGISTGVEISIFWSGIGALSVVFAAYASEVFLGSLRAMEGSTLEAAKALGLGRWITLYFITLPELFRLSRAGLSNLWLSLVKQTSLLSVIGYDELMHKGYIAASSTNERIFFYAVVCVMYLAICGGSGPLFNYLIITLSSERKRAG
jgi:polar amino acid transport system permease protein